ncbi:MAG: NAD-dependent epimerase/dehydratase family protein [Rubrivivax sp.]|nr:MAG: NAD-dependent epimerase/dehydratase family protein [Rubrivivax sp.]
MKPSLLIIGCGDVGLRVVKLLAARRWRVIALTSNPARAAALRALGVVPLVGNLDEPATLMRLAGLADRVLHLAPPAPEGLADSRTRHLLASLAWMPPQALVYASTTGVYGDCGGEFIDETRALNPATERALRRVDAEAQLRAFAHRHRTRVSLLRIPGIYARDREGGHPRERLARGTPVLRREDDVFTNHIHADDLAHACLLALLRGRPQRAVNVCDDSQMLMGDYFDLAADLAGLPRPERISRAEAAERMSAMQLSFWSESRRLVNARLKRELRLKLRYPTPRQGL